MTAILLVTYQYTIAVTALDAIYEDLDDFYHGLLNPCRCPVHLQCSYCCITLRLFKIWKFGMGQTIGL